MGQIFDRIYRIARSYLNDQSPGASPWADDLLDSDDEELRSIIDELQNGPPPPNLPQEVREALAVFALSSDATAADIKATYRQLMTTWHPDRFVRSTEEDQQRAHQRAREINAAYVILRSYYAKR